MIKKLELSYPAKPYVVTQKFGIKNSAYEQFGFSRHNGEDFRVDADGIVVAMCRGVVIRTGDNPTGAGKYVEYRTLEPVEAEGSTGHVAFTAMHGERILVKPGDSTWAGTPLMVADNTGFSTGPHTHISAYFVDPTTGFKIENGNKETNHCFDFSKYYNGFYADDVFGWNAKLAQIGAKLGAIATAVAKLFIKKGV